MDCPANADNFFGPRVDSCFRSFDFTIRFEESILSLLPSLLFFLVAPCRLWFLKDRSKYASINVLLVLKLAAIVVFGGLQLALLSIAGVRAHEPGLPHGIIIASSVLGFVNSFNLGLLSYFEHRRTIRPSTILGFYLFFTLIFDIVRVRTQWLARYNVAVAGILTSAVGVKLLIILLEAKGKSRHLEKVDKERPEELAGPFSKSLFLWLLPILRRGYGKVISMNDLYLLDHNLLSRNLAMTFERVWGKSPKKGGNALLASIIVTLKWAFLAPIFARLCLLGFTFAQPFLINTVTDYLGEPDGPDTKNIGYGLIGAFGLVYIGIAISTGWYQYLLYRFITMFRGILVSVLFNKTLDVSLISSSDSAAVTLMSTDVERIIIALPALHEIWAAIVQVAIAAWLLQRQLGWPFFLPIVWSFVCALIAVAISVLAGSRQKAWLEVIQERLGATSSMLKGMKGVKMSGLTDSLFKLVAELRAKEISTAFKYRMLLLSIIIIAFAPQTIAPVLTFGTYLATNHGLFLNSARLFSSLLLLRLITQPLNTVFQAAPTLISSMACLGRIQEFILSDSREDYRQTSRDSQYNSQVDLSKGANLPEIKVSDEHSLESQSTIVAEKRLIEPDMAITVKSGYFGWKVDDTPILHDINFNIRHSQLTMLVGPAASGKSTLLKALLGELPASRGLVHVSSSARVAFCDQTPWLINGTIQQNILGFSNYERDWYAAIVHACCLEEDLTALPDGDQTLIGSNGINLSGGQKQRLAVARAVYSRCKIVLLDDVLSGLDPTTETQLFNRLLGKGGLLRQGKIAVVLATHAIRELPFADHIIALDSSGSISEQGTFESLQSSGGYISTLKVQQRDIQLSLKREIDSTHEYPLGPKRGEALKPASTDVTRQVGDTEVYMYYFRSNGLINCLIYFGLQIAWATLLNFPTLWLQWWSNSIARGEPRNTYYLGAYTGFQLSYLLVLCMLGVHVFQFMQVKSGNGLHMVLLKAVMAAPMAFFNITDSGAILNIFSQDIQLLDADLPFALQNMVANAMNSIAQALLILPASYWLAISFPFLIGVFYVVQAFYLRTSRQLRLLDLEAKSPLYTIFLESLSGLATIRAYGWQEDLMDLNERLLDESQRPFYILYCVQRWLTLVLDLVVAGLAIVLIVVAVQLRDNHAAGFSGVALFNLANLAQTMTTTVTTWTLMEVAMGAVARIKNFERDTPVEHMPAEVYTPPTNWPSRGQVDFNNVVASYKDGEVMALDNLSLSINAGEKIGICGRSGSGKSSLLLALFRMIPSTSGTIKIDGVDISTIPRNTLRQRLTAIPQDPFFFTGSIRLNLDPHSLATSTSNDNNDDDKDNHLITVLQRVGLWSHIEKLGGLSATLDVDQLSHGQRQLFCLARAIINKTSVVVLDEATASVDVDTDRRMQEVIRESFAGCTIIAIAHRLETIVDFDRVAVLEGGVLVEFDRPDVLLGREGSRFKALYDADREGRDDS